MKITNETTTALDAYAAKVAELAIMAEELNDYVDGLHDTDPDTLKWSEVADIERVAYMMREVLQVAK